MIEGDNSRKQIEEMKQYYEARAPWHDQYMSYESNERMEELLRPIIETFEEIIRGKRIIEIACGTGNWTEVLAKRATFVTAIDSSHSALKIAHTKLSCYKNVALIQGDAYDLSYIESSFEMMLSVDWLSHVPKRLLPEFLGSVSRKLLPGSKAVFIDMLTNEYFRQEPCGYDEDGNRVSLRTLPDGSEYQVIKNFPSESELRSLLAPFGGSVDYYEFSTLKRWMAVLSTA